jgi:hypothetical protein
MFYLSKGYNCCSESTISFHYVKKQDVEKIDKMIEKYKSSNVTQIIKEFLNI